MGSFIRSDRLEVWHYLTLSQNDLIKQIAKREDINMAIVRKVLKATEKIIFDHLSSTTPSENMVVKPLKGLTIECKYIPQKEMHTYKNLKIKDKIWAKPKITRHYNRTLNDYFS